MTVTCVKKFIKPEKGKTATVVKEREVITDKALAAYAVKHGYAVDDAPAKKETRPAATLPPPMEEKPKTAGLGPAKRAGRKD